MNFVSLQNTVKKLLAIIEAGHPDEKRTDYSLGRMPTPQRKFRSDARQNHSKGESKARRKMAAMSRRINRLHDKRK